MILILTLKEKIDAYQYIGGAESTGLYLYRVPEHLGEEYEQQRTQKSDLYAVGSQSKLIEE